MKRIPYDPRFENVDYHNTDLHATFARIRKKMKDEAERAGEGQRKSAVLQLRKSREEKQ